MLIATSAAAQGTFEGTVVYRVTGPDAPQNGQIRLYEKGHLVRQDMEIPNEPPAVFIHDADKGESIVLIPARKQYIVMDQAMGERMRGAAGGMAGRDSHLDFSKVKVTPTGKHETIAGVGCDHYLFSSTDSKDDETVDMCGASGMGILAVPGSPTATVESTRALMQSQNPAIAKLARQGFFALKITANKGGEQPFVMEATQVDRHPPDNALFTVPSGYSQLAMPGMRGP